MEARRLGEERSVAFHRAVAARLRDDPRLLTLTRARVLEWLATGRVHPEYAEAWRALLARPLEELCAALVAEGEPMSTLRSVTPFAGALDPRERWRIWRSCRSRREVA